MQHINIQTRLDTLPECWDELDILQACAIEELYEVVLDLYGVDEPEECDALDYRIVCKGTPRQVTDMLLTAIEDA